MICINEPKILDEIVKNLFKKKRTTPDNITIMFESDTVRIYWKNNHCTEITDIFVCIDIVFDKDGNAHGIIVFNPKSKVKKQYRFATFVFDITNFRKGEVV